MYYVVRKSPPSHFTPVWTVGFFDPSGVWHAESDWDAASEAHRRVHWLNGNGADSVLAMALRRLLEDCKMLIGDGVSYCEMCDRHAPKNEQGALKGPVVHDEDCAVGLALAALDTTGGR